MPRWTPLTDEQKVVANYHPCAVCGKLISPPSVHCRVCSGNLRMGANHPMWKGGKIQNKIGYIFIYKPGHPRAKANYVIEHILVWEEAHGKPVPKGWVIHHLNGIKYDNRPSNLIAMPKKRHDMLVEAMRQRIQELEGLLNGQHQLL